MTKIIFERSGGLLGQAMHVDLDLNTLPASEALTLMNHIQASNFFKLPEDAKPNAHPDEYVYTITVEAGSTQHRVQTTDTAAPEALRPMLETLSSLATVA